VVRYWSLPGTEMIQSFITAPSLSNGSDATASLEAALSFLISRTHLVILLLSRKLGDPLRLTIEGDLDLDLDRDLDLDE